MNDLNEYDSLGIRCMLATSFAFYCDFCNYQSDRDRDAAINLMENALRRYWLPSEWETHISTESIKENLEAIMRMVPAVLDVTGGKNETEAAWKQTASLCEPNAGGVLIPPILMPPEWVEHCKPHLARMLRYYYLWGLHLENHRYDANYDWRDMLAYLAKAAETAGKPKHRQYSKAQVEKIVRFTPRFLAPESPKSTWDQMRALL